MSIVRRLEAAGVVATQAEAARVFALALVLCIGPIGPSGFWVRVLHLGWLVCIGSGLSYWTLNI